MDDIKTMGASGADLSYDFVNRPAYHHALVTGDTEFLRLTLNTSLELGIDPASLVHALQNHDELTHELVHFSTRHRDDMFTFAGEELTGCDLAERVRTTLNTRLTGAARAVQPHVHDERHRVHDRDRHRRHARHPGPHARSPRWSASGSSRSTCCWRCSTRLQPGVFALSGWDLAGMLTVDAAEVADLIAEGDTRWLNRGAHDLRGVDDPQREGRMPPGRSLYGTLGEQLADPDSFARRLAKIIEVRRRSGIATATQIDVPDVSHKSELVMVHNLRRPRAADHRAELLGRVADRQRPLRAPARWRDPDRHADRRGARHGRRPAQLQPHARGLPGPLDSRDRVMLAGKHAVIYGAGVIGSAVARAFAREGATVHLAGRNLKTLQPLAEEIGADTAEVDVTDPASVDSVRRRARAHRHLVQRRRRRRRPGHAAGRDGRRRLHAADREARPVAVPDRARRPRAR